MHADHSITTDPLLQIEDLSTFFYTPTGIIKAVRNLSMVLHAGQTTALVGESGCGKSMTALSILGLVPKPGRIVDGHIWFDKRDLTLLAPEQLRRVRGNQIAMIFQDPMTALNPVFSIGTQIEEVLLLHQGLSKKQARVKAAQLLHQVGMPNPQERLDSFPHQLSGGMRQRATIAMALACDPQILIADEPTTALDVTIQAQIMHLLRSQQRQRQMGLLLISHDLGVVAQHADQIALMYAGMIVEQADTFSIFDRPHHPYTRHLLSCISADSATPISTAAPHSQAQWPPHFRPRTSELPPMLEVDTGHWVRAWEVSA
ncbi:MAG: ABC transporter ATP-binding protein [Desulfuromonadaceae bacterium]|nr:ABC transporter ATP-binding protein [Desulfuromonadaceae bacterium]